MSAVLSPLQGCSWNMDQSLHLFVRIKDNNVDGGFIDAWHTKAVNVAVSVEVCWLLHETRTPLKYKLKPATSFSHTLTAEPVSGESMILAARRHPPAQLLLEG